MSFCWITGRLAGPCCAAAPQLEALQQEFLGQPFQVVGVSAEEEEIVAVADRNNYPYALWMDPEKGISKQLAPGVCPHLYWLIRWAGSKEFRWAWVV